MATDTSSMAAEPDILVLQRGTESLPSHAVV